jgi:hypothetical protein
MLYKQKIKNTNLVSENRNLFLSTWNTQWGVNTVGFPLFYDYDKKGRDAVFRLFRQMGSLLRGRLFGGLLHFEGTSYKYHAHSCITVITSRYP